MPINTNLNIAPYFDDFDVEKQFYKILFKPAYAVQARELTQLQTILQNQVEQFADNIYQEGSIIKGCNFTEINKLEFVKLQNKTGFDPKTYIGGTADEVIAGLTKSIDTKYEIEGQISGLKASIITADRGFETRPPNLNTFFIKYLNTSSNGTYKQFIAGETLTINKYRYDGSTLISTDLAVATISVTLLPTPTGSSFGIQAAAGVIFQKGNFIFAEDQTLIVSKYSSAPTDLSVGYAVQESLITSSNDTSLFDNANGSANENAPGADRLKLVPVLTVKETSIADTDEGFFTLIRYQNGNAVSLRDVAQFNSINEELARRTYEESGNYVVGPFKVITERRNSNLTALIGAGSAYIKGYRVATVGTQADVIPNITETNIQENQATSLNYSGYINYTTLSGTFELNYDAIDLRDSGNVVIGKAFVKNITPTKIFLMGVNITAAGKSFNDVRSAVGSSGQITFPAGAKPVNGIDKAPFVFDTGTKSIKDITDTSLAVRKKAAATISSNEITINAEVGEDFAVTQNDILVVDASNSYIRVTGTTTSLNNSVLTISLNPADSPDPSGTVYFNARKTIATPYSKQSVEPYVKVTWVNGTSQYSLGFPDVYKIESVEDSAGTDFTDSFKLVSNQKDSFYDLSYMQVIPGRPTPTGVLTVKLKVFKINDATGSNFFTVNSYPTDDVTDQLPDGKIRSHDIPTFTSSAGYEYRLRECFDFRPYADLGGGASYTALTPAAASLITNTVGDNVPSFSTNDYVFPMLNGNITSDIEHYLARIDVVTVDSNGVAKVVRGTASEIPRPPAISGDQLVVSEIHIPGFPMLSPKEGRELSKQYYTVKTKVAGPQNYTMRDIGVIEQRLEGLEYYISLNQLEQETSNLNVLDENGLNRFKNGFVVDPFKDTGVSNLRDPNYSAAIHSDKEILTPGLRTFPLDLKFKGSTSATISPSTNNAEVATLGRNAHVSVLSQPYATNFRNCVSNFWDYTGQGQLSPSHDMNHDTVTNPSTFTGFSDMIEEMQAVFPIVTTPISSTSTRNTIRTGGDWRRTDTTTTTINETQTLVSGPLINNKVGDFVANVEFQPFMRARTINIFAAGLRPNTQHYFFFDGVDVNDNVRRGEGAANNAREVLPLGNLGDDVKTDANGILMAVFELPADSFYVGDRKLIAVDVDQFDSIESGSTSKIELEYHAYNINIEKTALTATTRIPELVINTNTTTRTVAGRAFREENNSDPLAQTFFIKNGMGRGAKSIFASKIDLYFKRKSELNGVTVELREVVNGYPSGVVLPFSKVHLASSSVNVSDDASAVTTVDFEAPVRFDVEKEYAVVILPDANDPNYLHFTSVVGGTDLTPGATNGQSVVQDWGDGVLFTSTNNRAWQSQQDEDIKFTLYRHDFNSASGAVTLTNDDHEFLTLSDWTGRFNQNEFVYKTGTVLGSTGTSVQMTINTNIITGTSLGDTYAAGDFILVTASDGTTKEIFEIITVDSPTQMTTKTKVAFTVGSGTGAPICVGKVSFYNSAKRSLMHLAGSSAKATLKFEAGDTITGHTSGVTGTISTVDNINLSYVQPLITKSNDSATATTIEGTFTDPTTPTNSYTQPMKFGDNNTFTRKGVVIYSVSNDTSRNKPFDITVNMSNNTSSTTTPVVDLALASLNAYQYITTGSADTAASYISNSVQLADNLDAEDLNVILTAYKPNNTDVKVYIRPQNNYDSAAFDTNPWVELEVFEGEDLFSSSVNPADYKEFKYRVKEADKDADGVLAYTSTAGEFAGFKTFAIKITMISSNISQVPTLKDMRAIALMV